MKRCAYFLALISLCLAMLLLPSCGVSARKQTYYAMGTYCTVSAYGEIPKDLAQLLVRTEGEISHRLSDSLIARANGGETVRLPEDLESAISLCKGVYEATEGRFDISVLSLTALWNFDTAPSMPPDAGEIATALTQVGFDRVVFLEQSLLSVTGGAIDLGAIGKGLACDRLVARLDDARLQGLVSVGGSLGIAGEGRRYSIGIRNPFSERSADLIGTLQMTDRFVSTSGTYEKNFEANGRIYHHLLNATTGYPEDNGLISVTVVADSGVLSDALSTAAYLVGEEQAISLCREYGASVIAVKVDGTVLVSKELEGSFFHLGRGEVIYQ